MSASRKVAASEGDQPAPFHGHAFAMAARRSDSRLCGFGAAASLY